MSQNKQTLSFCPWDGARGDPAPFKKALPFPQASWLPFAPNKVLTEKHLENNGGVYFPYFALKERGIQWLNHSVHLLQEAVLSVPMFPDVQATVLSRTSISLSELGKHKPWTWKTLCAVKVAFSFVPKLVPLDVWFPDMVHQWKAGWIGLNSP